MFIIKTSKSKKDLTVLDNMEDLFDIRTDLLKNPIAKEICSDNNIGEWFLEAVPIMYYELDVSAKTEDGNIMLSEKLKEHPHSTRMRYVFHELVHAIQHSLDKNKDIDKTREYLKREDEQEAFKYQLKYDEKKLSKKDVKDYIKNLLDHHDVQKKDKEILVKELTSKMKSSPDLDY